MITSPTLKTLARGHPAGTANTSPSNDSRAPSMTFEFSNVASSTGVWPARRQASALAGITPPFAAIAAALQAAPAATTTAPGMCRLNHRKTKAMA